MIRAAASSYTRPRSSGSPFGHRVKHAALLALALLSLSGPARAEEPPPIRSNDFTLDVFQGPLLAPLRATGVGGAFAGYAEGVDAIASNAAAPAVREPYSVSYFDYDLSFSFYLPSAFKSTDFDNDGQVGFRYDNFTFLTLGASVQVGRFGLGILGDLETYDLNPRAQGNDTQIVATLGKLHMVAGWSVLDGQLSLGGGLRAVVLSFDAGQADGASTQEILSMTGVAPEFGVLIRPNWKPYRIGLTYRMAVEGGHEGEVRPDADGIVRAGELIVPRKVRLPWEVQLGFALQLGPRPLNPRWLEPHAHKQRVREQIEQERAQREEAYQAELAVIEDEVERAFRAAELADAEAQQRAREEERLQDESLRAERRARYWNWPRERITVLGELLVTGPSENAVSLESFFSQVAKPSGGKPSITPRLGIESEPVPDWLQTRLGTYIEPSRYEGSPARQHFTFGADLRLGRFSVFGLAPHQIWRVSGVIDVAPRYRHLGVSIGAWH